MTSNAPVSLNEKMLALSKLIGQMRLSLQTVQASLPPDVLGALSSLENSLREIGRQVVAVEEERRKLLALASTTQAVNSSLELDEVLQLVMDTIIRLTAAERGFSYAAGCGGRDGDLYSTQLGAGIDQPERIRDQPYGHPAGH